MPRVARVLADNEVYHVLNRGNGRSEVFHKPEDFQAFMNLIAEAKYGDVGKLCKLLGRLPGQA